MEFYPKKKHDVVSSTLYIGNAKWLPENFLLDLPALVAIARHRTPPTSTRTTAATTTQHPPNRINTVRL